MKYTQAQIEKLIIERDWTENSNPESIELDRCNKELDQLNVHDYHQAAIAVYRDEVAA